MNQLLQWINSEKKFNHEPFNELKDTTVIFITHRPSVLEFVDRILVLKDGKVFKQIDPKQNKVRVVQLLTQDQKSHNTFINQ